jgi:prophage regulatory protein
MVIRFLRKSDVIPGLIPIGKSTFHNQIKEGLIPPPVSIGGRAVAWPEHEIKAVCLAMLSGKTKDEIKKLVSSLVSQRQTREG